LATLEAARACASGPRPLPLINVAKLASERHVDAVIVAGDVFENNTLADDTLRKTLQAMRHFKDGKWILLPGNHDPASAESAWTRLERIGIPENIVAATSEETILLGEKGLAVLPAPLHRKHEIRDLTESFGNRKTPDGVIRVGLAHGSVENILPGEWDAAQPEKVQLQLEQAGKAVKEIQRDIDGLNEGIRELQTELRTLGQMGLGEKAEDLSAKLDGARAELQRVEREARAIKLLYEVLTQAEKEAKEEFLSPVTKRVQPYLKMLLPEAELVLDENIEITGLRRGSVIEPFGSLSLGTREQLAVLARLAFADLLHEKGQPAAVILDDAIVYADEERFKNMLLILAKAAKNLQVIVLTCHEHDYASSGAHIIRLADCRRTDSAGSIEN